MPLQLTAVSPKTSEPVSRHSRCEPAITAAQCITPSRRWSMLVLANAYFGVES